MISVGAVVLVGCYAVMRRTRRVCLWSRGEGTGHLYLHHAWIRPGIKPSMQRRMLMKESAEQRPDLIQTAIGGKRMAMRPRKISEQDMVVCIYMRCRVAM